MTMARHYPETLTRHAYWLAVLLPLLLPMSWTLRESIPALFAWLPLLVLYLGIPLADALLGRDLRNPDRAGEALYPDRLIPVVAAGVYLAVLGWSVAVAPAVFHEHGGLAFAGWVLSLGDISGAIGINVAHELIHRRSRALRNLGGLLLTCVFYPGFKLEHPRWHHVHVATLKDPSSAPVGSTVYRQVPRALWMNTRHAWQLSIAARGGGFGPLHEVAAWYALAAGLLFTVALVWGWLAAAVFVVQGILAAILLEVINYVEHYGLSRDRDQEGRFEAPSEAHSWDCDYWLSNAILLQLPRHADHHANPGRSFGALRRSGGAPVLPAGYPTLVLATFVPWLWRRWIHPRLRESKSPGTTAAG